MQRNPVVVLLVVAAAILCNESAAAWLQYDRMAIRRGQVWRFLTCHFTHWSVSHFIFSAGAFLVLAVTVEIRTRPPIRLVLIGSGLAISLAIFFLIPSLQYYRGLSGIDSALYGLLAITILQQRPRNSYRTTAALGGFIGFVAKVWWETKSSRAVFATADGGLVPLPLAHVAGLASGVVAGIISYYCHERRMDPVGSALADAGDARSGQAAMFVEKRRSSSSAKADPTG